MLTPQLKRNSVKCQESISSLLRNYSVGIGNDNIFLFLRIAGPPIFQITTKSKSSGCSNS